MSNEKKDAIEKAGSSGIQQYGSFDLGDMEQEEQKLPAGGGNFFEPQTGKNVIRFLPPLKGKLAIKTWYKHYFQAGGERKAIVCTKLSFNQPCPLCERRLKLASSGSRADQKQARAYEAGAKVYANIVDMKNPEKGVQVFRCSPGLFKKIRKAIDIADVGKIFADPLKGFNIVFGKTGAGLDTEYDPVAVARESTPLPDWEELLPQQVDLDSLEAAPTDEEQDDAVDGEFESKPSKYDKKKGKEKEGKESRGGARRERGTEDAETDDDKDDLDF